MSENVHFGDIAAGTVFIIVLVNYFEPPAQQVIQLDLVAENDALDTRPGFPIRPLPVNLIHEVKLVSPLGTRQMAPKPEVSILFPKPAVICLRCQARKKGGSSRGGPGD